MRRVCRAKTAGLLVAAVAAATVLLPGCASGTGASQVAHDYLSAWPRRDWTAMRALVASRAARLVAGAPDDTLVGFNNVVARTGIAFAMITVDGGEGGPTDGPVVAKFLDLLRQYQPDSAR